MNIAAPLSNSRSPKDFAKLINGAWRKGAEAFIAVGRYLIEAENELGPDQYSDLVFKLDFDASVARKLRRIAGNEVLCAHVHKLPPCWSTNYELSKLDDSTLTAAIGTREIHPGMQRKDAVALRKPLFEEPDKTNNSALADGHEKEKSAEERKTQYAALESNTAAKARPAVPGDLETGKEHHVDHHHDGDGDDHAAGDHGHDHRDDALKAEAASNSPANTAVFTLPADGSLPEFLRREPVGADATNEAQQTSSKEGEQPDDNEDQTFDEEPSELFGHWSNATTAERIALLLQKLGQLGAVEFLHKTDRNVLADLFSQLHDLMPELIELYDRLQDEMVATVPTFPRGIKKKLLADLTANFRWAAGQDDPALAADGLNRIKTKLAVNKLDLTNICFAFEKKGKR